MSEEADAVIASTPRDSASAVVTAIANTVRQFGLKRFAGDMTILLEHQDRAVRSAAFMALLRLEGAAALDRLWRAQWTDLDCPELFYRAMTVLPPSVVPEWIERLENQGGAARRLSVLHFLDCRLRFLTCPAKSTLLNCRRWQNCATLPLLDIYLRSTCPVRGGSERTIRALNLPPRSAGNVLFPRGEPSKRAGWRGIAN
ncbi:hypothetical protein GPU89_39045 [Burkholderia cepacia]|nr:hypothetical protein [Burkholderia cepacia]NLA21365.1 hypothetical protein [Burkholderia cepacia]